MPVTIKNQTLLTLRECAEIVGVTKRRIQQFVEDGRLRATKIGNMYHVDRKELKRFQKIARPAGNRSKIK